MPQVKSWAVSPGLFPCQPSAAGERLCEEAVAGAVEAWGERKLGELEAEDRLAFACEKAPTMDPVIEKVWQRGVDMVSPTELGACGGR